MNLPIRRFARSMVLALLPFWGWVGCAGGGGTTHNAPTHVVAEKPTPLKLEVSVWGAGKGLMTARYQEVTLHYRTPSHSTFKVVAMQPVGEFKELTPKLKRGLFKGELPAFPESARSVEYYFSFRFDGRAAKRPIVIIPIRKEGELSEPPLPVSSATLGGVELEQQL